MKELHAFRKFLAEGEAKGFTFIFRKGKTGEEQLKKAKAILKSKKISFTSPGEMALGFSASQNQKDVKKVLGDNSVTQYVIGDIKEDLTEGQLNENIEQIFIDTYEGYADGATADPNDIDEFTYEEEEMTDPEEYENDEIADFKAMQDYLRKNKEFVHSVPGYTDDLGIAGKFTYEDTKVIFTLEPNEEDIKMVMGPISKLDKLKM